MLAEVSANVPPPPGSFSANNSYLNLSSNKHRVDSSGLNLSAVLPPNTVTSSGAPVNYLSNPAPSSSAAKIMTLRSKSQKRISEKAIKKIVSSLELSKESSATRRRDAESLARSNAALAEGKDFLLQKNYQEAIRCFTAALKTHRANNEAKFYRGICYLDSGSTKKAIQEFCEVIDSQPDFKRTIYVVLSIAYRRVNDITGALRTLSRAIMKYPRYAESYLARG